MTAEVPAWHVETKCGSVEGELYVWQLDALNGITIHLEVLLTIVVHTSALPAERCRPTPSRLQSEVRQAN